MTHPREHPVIAISGSSTDNVASEVNRSAAAERAKAAIEAAGGRAVVIDHSKPNSYNLADFDGFMLMGNYYDIDPKRYGQKKGANTAVETNAASYPSRAEYEIGKRRYEFEEAAIKYAVKEHLPLMGICGGMQRINVALGGTLDQTQKNHIQPEEIANHATPTHPLNIEPGTRLYRIAKASGLKAFYVPVAMDGNGQGVLSTDVNSFHNMTVKDPGVGLMVSATAADGFVEAFESIHPEEYIRGYQWHPESLPDMPLSKAIFEDFTTEVKIRHTDRLVDHPPGYRPAVIPIRGSGVELH